MESCGFRFADSGKRDSLVRRIVGWILTPFILPFSIAAGIGEAYADNLPEPGFAPEHMAFFQAVCDNHGFDASSAVTNSSSFCLPYYLRDEVRGRR